MANPYGITLDDYSLRWATAEGVPESVIAAICLLPVRSVDEIVARLSPVELGQVVNIVGRSPSCYPPGAYAALKGKRDLASPPPRADRPPPKGAANEQARPPQKATALRQLAGPPQEAAPLRQHTADGAIGAGPTQRRPERLLRTRFSYSQSYMASGSLTTRRSTATCCASLRSDS